jgi:hypothetical protein
MVVFARRRKILLASRSLFDWFRKNYRNPERSHLLTPFAKIKAVYTGTGTSFHIHHHNTYDTVYMPKLFDYTYTS